VDITQPGWLANAATAPSPLDEAGVRDEAESLLRELLDYYGRAPADHRAEIRRLFVECPAFAWASRVPDDITSPETLRQHLLFFSIVDQGRDSRDALLWLRDVCRRAAALDMPLQAVLTAVAALSSDVDRYGMGSTRAQLLEASKRLEP
jgi:hypothetical protein